MPPYEDSYTIECSRCPQYAFSASGVPVVEFDAHQMQWRYKISNDIVDAMFKNESFLARLREFITEEQKKVHLDDETLDNIWDRLITQSDGRKAT